MSGAVNPDDIRGKLIGITASDEDERPDFEEIPVWVDPESDPDLESFVVIERESGVLQYGRLSSGYEMSDRADPQRQQRDRSFKFDNREIRESNLSPDVVRVMRVELLGEVEFAPGERLDDNESGDSHGFSVRRPTKLPRVGQEVYEMGAEELPTLLDIPDEDEEGLDIGIFESGGESVHFKLDPKFVSRHVAILGRTGVGKTYAAHVIIEELINYDGVMRAQRPDADVEFDEVRGVPVVTFDIEDDVGAMAAEVGGTTLRPYGTEDDIADDGLESMSIPFQLIGWNEFDRFLGDMPSDKQREVIASAYSLVRHQALTQLEEEGRLDVGVEEFENLIQVRAEQENYNYADTAVRRAINTIERSPVLGEDMNDWAELMTENPIVNIDVSELGDSELGAVVSATARMLQLLREQEAIPPFVLVMDEAHEFVPAGRSGESTDVVRDLVKTARHIGIGVVMMTQAPSELDGRTLRTCNTYITLALAEDEVTEIKGLLGDLSQRSLEQIPNMEQGRAFVGSARDIMIHTVPVDIRERKSAEASPTMDLVEKSESWLKENGGQLIEEDESGESASLERYQDD